MTYLATRRQISTEIEAVKLWSTSDEHAVPRPLAIRLESVRRTATVHACGLPYELQMSGKYSIVCRSWTPKRWNAIGPCVPRVR